MVSIGAMEMLVLLLMSAAGRPTDLVSQLSPQDYFKVRGIELSSDKLVELAIREPRDGSAQVAQLLALRRLGEDGAFKKAANYATQRKLIEEIAAGKKAQDRLGFAKEYARRTLALIDGMKPPSPPALGAREEGLAWFPPSATLVGGIEYRPSADSETPKSSIPELLKMMPAEAKNELYKSADALGNVEIRRLTFAFSDDGNDQGRNFLRLSGRMNHAWVRAHFKTAGLDATEDKNLGDGVTIISGMGRGPAIALVGDHDFLVAGFSRGGNDVEVLRQALAQREKKQPDAASAALKATLEKIPAKANGYLAGEFPESFRRDLNRTFGTFPKTVAAHLERAPTGMDFILRARMDDEDQAKTFVKSADKFRMEGLEALQKAPPNPIPGIDLGELKNTLESLRLEAKGSDVSARMLLPNQAMEMAPLFFMGRAASGPVAPPVEKKEN